MTLSQVVGLPDVRARALKGSPTCEMFFQSQRSHGTDANLGGHPPVITDVRVSACACVAKSGWGKEGKLAAMRRGDCLDGWNDVIATKGEAD